MVVGGSYANTPPQSEPLIVRTYRCTPSIERFLLDEFANGVGTLSPYLPKAIVDAHFLLNSPTWWELRRDVFVTTYRLEQDTVPIAGIPTDVYLINRQWMFDLKNAFDDGIVSPSDPMCYQVNFVNSP